MACPYFHPSSDPLPPLESLPLPLGDGWKGQCYANPDAPCEPEPAHLVSLCHLGYARGRCPQFRDDDPGPDAVRFTVAKNSGTSIDLYYVLERDHHPFSHGPLSYFVATRSFSAPPAGPVFRRQAEAYIESYLRRQTEASQCLAASTS